MIRPCAGPPIFDILEVSDMLSERLQRRIDNACKVFAAVFFAALGGGIYAVYHVVVDSRPVVAADVAPLPRAPAPLPARPELKPEAEVIRERVVEKEVVKERVVEREVPAERPVAADPPIPVVVLPPKVDELDVKHFKLLERHIVRDGDTIVLEPADLPSTVRIGYFEGKKVRLTGWKVHQIQEDRERRVYSFFFVGGFQVPNGELPPIHVTSAPATVYVDGDSRLTKLELEKPGGGARFVRGVIRPMTIEGIYHLHDFGVRIEKATINK